MNTSMIVKPLMPHWSSRRNKNWIKACTTWLEIATSELLLSILRNLMPWIDWPKWDHPPPTTLLMEVQVPSRTSTPRPSQGILSNAMLAGPLFSRTGMTEISQRTRFQLKWHLWLWQVRFLNFFIKVSSF